ncbi:MAG: hypothetical protein PWQ96_829 [Clostridia bacterium]|nr:hypothetical protein [Clostridia bacterium]
MSYLNNHTKIFELLSNKIIEKGKITFKEFMQTALYQPESGYYTGRNIDIGKTGDFYTSSNVHPVFGWCIAQQIYDMWETMGNPSDFIILELGAGTGMLAKDILSYLKKNFQGCFEHITYQILEVSSTLMEKQQVTLNDFQEKLQWGTPQEPIIGVIFSNEFFDALPVHRVKKIGGEIKELYIVLKDGKFSELYDDLSEKEEIMDYLETSGVKLKEGQQIEVCLEAKRWVDKIAAFLKKGFHLAIDYGYLASELDWPHRFDGTLMCYKNHKAVTNPYMDLGEQDITAHVNFSALQSFGEKAGLVNTGFTNQMKFLVNLGIFEKMQIQSSGFSQGNEKKNLALKRLIMPEGMGETFKVLIQHKRLKNFSLKSLKNFG